jgi:hypothetical protein
MAAENPSAAPSVSVIPPAQSHRVQPSRQRRAGSDSHASQSSPSTRTAKRIDSCVRVHAAATHAPAAPATRDQLGATSVRPMSHSASVARG